MATAVKQLLFGLSCFVCGIIFASLLTNQNIRHVSPTSYIVNSIQKDKSQIIYKYVDSVKTVTNIPISSNTETNTRWTGKLIRYTGNEWREVECVKDSGFKEATLAYPTKTKIYVYDQKLDVYVSGSVLRGGNWERGLVEKIYKLLKEDKKLTFLDIGSNIGVFSMAAATLGNRIISIDCLPGNVMRLCASMHAGNFKDRMTIIHNALSDYRANFTFGTHKANVGGTYIKNTTTDTKQDSNTIINSILLDDLLDIFHFDKVVIKMDVETHEAKVLAGAEKFFSKVFVKFIMLEFVAHRGSSGKFIVDFLQRHNMEVIHEGNYNRSDIRKWPGNLMFKHKDVI